MRFAGGRHAVEARLAAAARAFGTASQLADDLEDLWGEATSRDLANGIWTWPVAWALKRAGTGQEALVDLLRRARTDASLHGAVRTALDRLDARARTRLEIEAWIGTAWSEVARLGCRAEVEATLRRLFGSPSVGTAQVDPTQERVRASRSGPVPNATTSPIGTRSPSARPSPAAPATAPRTAGPSRNPA